MHEPDPMRGVQRRGDLLDDLHRSLGIQWAPGQDVLQVFALDQAHVDIQPAFDLPEVVDRHHVRVVQRRRGEGLASEPLLEHGICGQLRRQHLDRHHPLGRSVERLPDLAHAAAAQQLDQSVPAEWRSLHYASRRQRRTSSVTAITLSCRVAARLLLQSAAHPDTDSSRILAVY